MFTCPTFRCFPQVLFLVQKQVVPITARLDALSQAPDESDAEGEDSDMLSEPDASDDTDYDENSAIGLKSESDDEVEPDDVSIPILEPCFPCAQNVDDATDASVWKSAPSTKRNVPNALTYQTCSMTSLSSVTPSQST